MNLLEQLDWSYWKRLTPKEKRTLVSQLLLHFVTPLMKITDIELKDFELFGIKCQTFQLVIDDEEFVFVPGNQKAILGWNLGTKGLSLLETAPNSHEITIPKELRGQYNFFDVDSLGELINEKTSNLRKVQIPPMFVQRRTLPAGTNYLGVYDSVTGGFEGEADQFSTIEKEIKDVLSPNLTPAESLTWSFPKNVLSDGQWYIEMIPNSDCYAVYNHERHTYASLRKKIRRKNFDLLTEDQWEYVNGAGSRRLFRWGNDLAVNDPYRGKKIQKTMTKSNMFGLYFDTSMTRFELTEDPGVLKLKNQQNNTGIPVVDFLPLSTYYVNDMTMLKEDEILAPSEYLYRKAILINI